MNDLMRYSKAVEDYASRGENYLFHNEGNEHALIILKNIFVNSKRHIRIAANRLYNDEVVNTPDYIESMKTFLDSENARLSIIITQKPTVEEVKNCGDTFYKMLYKHRAYGQNRIEIKEGKGRAFYGQDGQQINFCTGDEKMYRYENDIIARKAIANFGDSEKTQSLIAVFDKVFSELSSKVDLKEYYI